MGWKQEMRFMKVTENIMTIAIRLRDAFQNVQRENGLSASLTAPFLPR